MMTIQEIIKINKFGQGLISWDLLLDNFDTLEVVAKKNYLKELNVLIAQSKPKIEDIEVVIQESGLKKTYTPCVLLSKGVSGAVLDKIAELPEQELGKSIRLLLSLFKQAYKRRFSEEKGNPDKWWYWDLSKEDRVKEIVKAYGQ